MNKPVVPLPDQEIREKARRRLSSLTMPHWALGRLMDLALDLAGMMGTVKPQVQRKTMVVLAADHGVAVEGVSRYPSAVTAQMIANFVRGGAGINALARLAGARLVIVDMGVSADLEDFVRNGTVVSRRVRAGTANIMKGPAMTRTEAVRSMEAGIEIARQYASATDVFGTGDMGIGNTTASAAIVSCITRLPPEAVTGRGTGIDDERLRAKIKVVEASIAANDPDPSDGIDVLSKLGGFEIGGIAGLIIGAASLRKPVIIDGFISSAAALIAHTVEPRCHHYMIAAHRSTECGHGRALDVLGKSPLLDLAMRLGEGAGAALALHLVDAAAALLTDVATFEEASVSGACR